MTEQAYPDTIDEWSAYLDALPQPSVLPACPAWCVSGHSHKLLPTPDGGTVIWERNHTARRYTLELEHHPERYFPWVEIDQRETIAEDGSVSLDEVEMTVYSDGGVGLTPGEARRFAAALTSAADLFDEITGGAR